jgi:hypothetical protein
MLASPGALRWAVEGGKPQSVRVRFDGGGVHRDAQGILSGLINATCRNTSAPQPARTLFGKEEAQVFGRSVVWPSPSRPMVSHPPCFR